MYLRSGWCKGLEITTKKLSAFWGVFRVAPEKRGGGGVTRRTRLFGDTRIVSLCGNICTNRILAILLIVQQARSFWLKWIGMFQFGKRNCQRGMWQSRVHFNYKIERVNRIPENYKQLVVTRFGCVSLWVTYPDGIIQQFMVWLVTRNACIHRSLFLMRNSASAINILILEREFQL